MDACEFASPEAALAGEQDEEFGSVVRGVQAEQNHVFGRRVRLVPRQFDAWQDGRRVVVADVVRGPREESAERLLEHFPGCAGPRLGCEPVEDLGFGDRLGARSCVACEPAQ